MDSWVFGYGSLIWKPDIPFLERRAVRLRGWHRRFWQGSHDHRGTPGAPGRVVTLVAASDAVCDGIAYRLHDADLQAIFAGLDHREKNGYARHRVRLQPHDAAQSAFRGVVYIATPDNEAYLGPAPLPVIAAQIRSAHGPSGSNREYLLRLAEALRMLGWHDEHIFALEALVGQDPARSDLESSP